MNREATHAAIDRPPSAVGTTVKLEVVAIPVSDVDRSKRFYEQLGWRVDADFTNGSDWRLVQMTPPGSACSVMFGRGFTPAAPGSAQGTFLVVDDLEAARARLLEQGVSVTGVFHFTNDLLTIGGERREAGPDPQGRSYLSFASFADPDGNSWLLQQVTTRLPGRGLSLDVPTLTTLLREAETRHGAYEPSGPSHHWSQWYAAYLMSRERGTSPDDAAADAARHIDAAAGR